MLRHAFTAGTLSQAASHVLIQFEKFTTLSNNPLSPTTRTPGRLFTTDPLSIIVPPSLPIFPRVQLIGDLPDQC